MSWLLSAVSHHVYDLRVQCSLAYLHGSIVTVLVLWRHAHGRVDRWRRSRTIGGTSWAGIVLTAAPAKTDARVPNGISLHLVDGHLRRMTLHELDEATAFAGWDLDVGDLAEALEEGA